MLVGRRRDPVNIDGVSDPADPDPELYETGALVRGPDATVAGPTGSGGEPFAKNLNGWMGRDSDRFWAPANWKIVAPAIIGLLTLIAAVLVGVFVESWSAAGNPTT
jgi:hypothetical protein